MSDVTECSGCGEPITAAGCPWCRTNYETASLKAQLAAVEKERDEARNGPIYVMYCNAMHARRKAEEERDKATGALAAAQAALKRWRDEYEHAEDCEWMEHIDAEEDKDCTCYKRVAAEFLASPAADLAARHDAEVERRALEKAAERAREIVRHELNHTVLAANGVALAIRALATPTPEKPCNTCGRAVLNGQCTSCGDDKQEKPR